MSLTIRILLGLVLGILGGAALAAFASPEVLAAAIRIAEPVGGLWLDALRMTIVPLVFSLIVTGIASAAGMASGGGVVLRALLLFAVLLVAGAAFSAVVTPILLAAWPVPAEAAAALRASAPAVAASIPPTPPLGEMLRSFVPNNPVKAAADGAIAPLVLFALLFGLAAVRIAPRLHEPLVGLFQAIAATMLELVRWVLLIAPVGVFALALVVGARTGLAAAGVLAHYVLIVSAEGVLLTLALYPVAILAGRVRLQAFVAAMAPTQVVAVSTQSSLATLPAMLVSAERLGVGERVRDLVLPLAVSLFRITSPSMNMAVVIYVAAVHGVHLSLLQLAIGVVVAAVVSLAAVGIASQVTFFTTLGPISMSMGVPMDILPLLLAVETIPDIMRTVGNVTGDVTVTAIAARGSGEPKAGLTGADVELTAEGGG